MKIHHLNIADMIHDEDTFEGISTWLLDLEFDSYFVPYDSHTLVKGLPVLVSAELREEICAEVHSTFKEKYGFDHFGSLTDSDHSTLLADEDGLMQGVRKYSVTGLVGNEKVTKVLEEKDYHTFLRDSQILNRVRHLTKLTKETDMYFVGTGQEQYFNVNPLFTKGVYLTVSTYNANKEIKNPLDASLNQWLDKVIEENYGGTYFLSEDKHTKTRKIVFPSAIVPYLKEMTQRTDMLKSVMLTNGEYDTSTYGHYSVCIKLEDVMTDKTLAYTVYSTQPIPKLLKRIENS